jgi:hypothetical protein
LTANRGVPVGTGMPMAGYTRSPTPPTTDACTLAAGIWIIAAVGS